MKSKLRYWSWQKWYEVVSMFIVVERLVKINKTWSLYRVKQLGGNSSWKPTLSGRTTSYCVLPENVIAAWRWRMCILSNMTYFLTWETCYTEDANKVEIVCSITLEVERKHIYWVFEKVMGLYAEIVYPLC